MSGKRLATLLKSLGYKEELAPESLEWSFDYPETRAFLQWFCENVSPENALTSDELEELDSIKDKLLHGRELEDAVASLQALEQQGTDMPTTAEALEEDTEKIVSKTAAINREIAVLSAQRDMLSTQHTATLHRSEGYRQLAKDTRDDLRTLEAGVVSASQELNRSVDSLISHVSDISERYRDDDSGAFLYNVDATKLFEAEDAFIAELENYYKKQHVDGVLGKIGEDNSTQYAFLDVSDPSSLFVQGERREAYIRHCNELKRLKEAYTASEKGLLDAEITLARTHAASAVLKQRSDSDLDDVDTAEIQRRLFQKDAELTEVTDTMDDLRGRVFPSLCEELAQIEASSILQGDYELKLARQEYHLAKMKELIGILLEQQSRLLLLLLALQTEHGHDKNVKGLLQTLLYEVETIVSEHMVRLSLLRSTLNDDESDNAATRTGAETVARNDSLIGNVNSVIGGSGSDVVTVDGLIGASSEFVSGVLDVESSASEVTAKRQEELDTIQGQVDTLHGLLYSDAATSVPQLSPETFTASRRELERLLEELRMKMDVIIRDRTQKEARLQYNHTASQIERTLFAKFYADPDALRKSVDGLTQRLHARSISSTLYK